MQEQKTPFELFPSDVKRRLFTDEALENRDRWALAYTCRSFYGAARTAALKEKIYSLGIVPDGLLDLAIFKRHEPNYRLLWEVLTRVYPVLLPLRSMLDIKYPWQLLAIMGMEDALIELIGDDPHQRDDNGHTVLDYLAMSGCKDVLAHWIDRCYDEFEVVLLNACLRLKTIMRFCTEDVLRFLVENYPGYELSWHAAQDDDNFSSLDMLLICGHKGLFWEQVEVNKSHINQFEHLPVVAARYKHWDVCDELVRRFFTLTEEQKAVLVLYAARDDHERFLRLVSEFENFDLQEFYLHEKNIFEFAIEGGHLETVIHVAEIMKIQKSRLCTGEQLAAKYGQIALVEHFLKVKDYGRLGRSKDPVDNAAMHGNWSKYQHLLSIYVLKKHYITPLLQWVIEGNGTDQSHLHYAIAQGHIYFAQKFIQKYGDQILLGESGEGLIAAAESNGCPTLIKWVKEQVEAVRLRVESSQLSQCLISRSGGNDY